MGFANVKIEVDTPVGWLVFNRPEKLNALNTAMMGEAVEALGLLEDDGRVKVVAVTGSGRLFSAGIDLGEVAGSRDQDASGAIFSRLARLFEALTSISKPLVIALNGHAYGGGAEMLWAGDIVVAVRGARIGWPEARWNLVPPLLPFLGIGPLGPARTGLLALTSGEITAEEAYRLGLVSDLVDKPEDLRGRVKEIASSILANSPESVRSILSMLRMARLQQAARIGVSELERLARSRLTIEAARSFRDSKRPPKYEW